MFEKIYCMLLYIFFTFFHLRQKHIFTIGLSRVCSTMASLLYRIHLMNLAQLIKNDKHFVWNFLDYWKMIKGATICTLKG